MARLLVLTLLVSLSVAGTRAEDWPMGGRDATRNPVSPEKGAPTDWQIATDNHKPRNIRWSAAVGSRAIGGPVVSDGLLWIGTNNDNPLDPKVQGDHGVLACFRATDGKFLYQYASARLVEQWLVWEFPRQSQSGSPLVEGDRLWFRSNRAEVVCFDIGRLKKGVGKATEVWKVDLIKEFKVFPRGMDIPGHDFHGSIAGYKDFLYLQTLNGRAADLRTVAAPDAPSLVCLRKDTGKLVWKDASPGKDILYGQFGSPLVVEINGKAQVIVPQGDGWVRSFDTLTGKLLWKFDLNRKPEKADTRAQRSYGVATPVYAAGRVFVSLGRHPEDCAGPGRLCCLDPTKSGDISSQLLDAKGKIQPNPNSGMVWEFTKAGAKDEVGMNLTMSSVAVCDGLVIAADSHGCIHCLDAKTGKRYWTDETKSTIFGAPLVVDGKVYVSTQDGDVVVLDLGQRKKRLARHDFEQVIVAGPIYANGTLYVLTEGRLHAIAQSK